MITPQSFCEDIEALPRLLRALLDRELAAGNAIAEVGHSFPAPPIGAYFKLARAITTRPRASGEGLHFRDFNSSIYSGEFTDADRRFFILEPPLPPPPEPDMDAIRAARNPAAYTVPGLESTSPAGGAAPSFPDTPRARFERSMVIDYEKWHDGIGYDLEALRALSPSERGAVETMLVHKRSRDWRDVEALAQLDTPLAREALKAALGDSDAQVRAAVIDNAPSLIPDAERTQSTVRALESAVFYEGLTQTLNQVEAFHPPEIVEALLKGALNRQGEVACHFAAMLFFLRGRAAEPFDMAQRPFFLRFNTQDREARETAFAELCAAIDIDPKKYLTPARPQRLE